MNFLRPFHCWFIAAGALLLGEAAVAETPVQGKAVRAYLILPSSEFQETWITGAHDRMIICRDSEMSGAEREVERSKIASIYFFQSPEFDQAMVLYRGRKYLEAKGRFAKIRADYHALQELPENPSTMAGFYELECLRHLDDLEGLSKALVGFHKEGLVQEHQLRQLEIDVFWDAVRTKSWERIDLLAQGRRDEKLPGYQRAQIAYCHALALENLNRPEEALDLYQVAITADAGASVSIATQSAINVLRIYKADPSVQVAIRHWGSADENVDAIGRRRLIEAASLAKMVEGALGSGVSLPGEFRDFLKYAPGKTASK